MKEVAIAREALGEVGRSQRGWVGRVQTALVAAGYPRTWAASLRIARLALGLPADQKTKGAKGPRSGPRSNRSAKLPPKGEHPAQDD